MPLFVPPAVIPHTTTDALSSERERTARSYSSDRDVTIPTRKIDDDLLADLARAAKEAGDKSFARVIESVTRARSGDFDKPIPRLTAFPEILKAYLTHHFLDGWLYKDIGGGRVEAYAVTRVEYGEGRTGYDDKPSVTVSLAQTGSSGKGHSRFDGLVGSSIFWSASDVSKKRVSDVLTESGYLVETPALRAAYDAQREHYDTVVANGYTEQFLYSGTPDSAHRNEGESGWSDRASVAHRTNRKVICLTNPAKVVFVSDTLSTAFVTSEEEAGAVEHSARRVKGGDNGEGVPVKVPAIHSVVVFDLAVQNFLTVHSSDLTRYVYDSSLADKLVLPQSHRHLLDILTTDIQTFVGDIIEGKSAGNVILAKGVPGVGKTLTAEVYSELVERPLYAIHSGSLGVTADSVRENLERVFDRAKRWNAILLLDEADVFVTSRGTDITQNAIVAEFLRTMEYFDGLMFMTTNLAANIDEAVISRCAAIIDYHIPNKTDQAKIWNVLATQFEQSLDQTLVDDLTVGFSRIAPRDIKMLLRLALRVSLHEGSPLSVDLFQKVAMFRGLAWDDEAYETHLGRTGRLDEED